MIKEKKSCKIVSIAVTSSGEKAPPRIDAILPHMKSSKPIEAAIFDDLLPDRLILSNISYMS